MDSSCPYATELECACAFGFATSGFVAGDPSTFPKVMDDKTVQRNHMTGEMVGTEAIQAYIRLYGGEFVTPISAIGAEPILDFSESTPGTSCSE